MLSKYEWNVVYTEINIQIIFKILTGKLIKNLNYLLSSTKINKLKERGKLMYLQNMNLNIVYQRCTCEFNHFVFLRF